MPIDPNRLKCSLCGAVRVPTPAEVWREAEDERFKTLIATQLKTKSLHEGLLDGYISSMSYDKFDPLKPDASYSIHTTWRAIDLGVVHAAFSGPHPYPLLKVAIDYLKTYDKSRG